MPTKSTGKSLSSTPAGMDIDLSTDKQPTSKVDPSFKSKRYRDKLRTEIKALEALIPVDRPALHRKLDSQTVFRLIIAYFRSKALFKAFGIDDYQDVGGLSTESSVVSDEESIPGQTAEQYLTGTKILEILDGFLLMTSTDGTIMYASENVLQYLGFNQVDLMHRCMYGVVHPEDLHDLKNVLEQREPFDATSQNHSCKRSAAMAQEKKSGSTSVSILCRMKCFSGNTAGYVKLHCVGKLFPVPELMKTTRTSTTVAILYCQPFMLTGSDITHDVKQDVFWSKHDMDLKLRELDKKAEEIIGYGAEEMNEESFYELIHPEDLFTCASCHKSLTDSTDVQTMYVRLRTKLGNWLWVHSRGKVICKNSKKFSIVFTHCPVRDEDSTFIQQESILRQRYAINDLINMKQFGFHSNPMFYSDLPDRPNAPTPTRSQQSSCSLLDPSGSHRPLIDISRSNFPTVECTNEDTSFGFESSAQHCPSSWHSMGERHSPILPSSHVAHKITQREKQLQFADFKRRQQQLEQKMQIKTEPWDGTLIHAYQNPNGPNFNIFCYDDAGITGFHNLQEIIPEISYKEPPQYNHGLCTPQPMVGLNVNFPNSYQVQLSHVVPFGRFQNIPSAIHFPPPPPYYLPPSPPPSPDVHHIQYASPVLSTEEFNCGSRQVGQLHSRPTSFSSGVPISQNLPNLTRHQQPQRVKKLKSHSNEAKNDQIPSIPQVQSHTNIRLSMSCNYHLCGNNASGSKETINSCSTGSTGMYEPEPDVQSDVTGSTNRNHVLFNNQSQGATQQACDVVILSNQIKADSSNNSHSCAVADRCCNNSDSVVQYDIEASVHMKIVENERKTLTEKLEVDLPSIGSFLEYLNDD